MLFFMVLCEIAAVWKIEVWSAYLVIVGVLNSLTYLRKHYRAGQALEKRNRQSIIFVETSIAFFNWNFVESWEKVVDPEDPIG